MHVSTVLCVDEVSFEKWHQTGQSPEAMSDTANSVNYNLDNLTLKRKFYNLEIL